MGQIARVNRSPWSWLGSGRSVLLVETLAVSGGDVYAGGSWGVDKWDGISWSRLNGLFGQAYRLAVSGSGDIYASGLEFQIGGTCCYNYAKWNGAGWSGIWGNGGWELGLAGYGNGFITGGASSTGIGLWNGTTWVLSALGLTPNTSSLNDDVWAIALSGNDTYVGGSFTVADGTAVNHITTWNGTNWSALGSGLNGDVFAVAVSGSNVYVGGYFTTAGGLTANNVAKWDGTSWSQLGSGVNDAVWAIAVSEG